jgi:outer membrane protein TolC
VQYERARERLQHLLDAAEASGRATELARLRYEEGAGDFLEVLDAERRLLEAEDRLSEGRTAATNALVGVYRSLGVGLTGEVRR